MQGNRCAFSMGLCTFCILLALAEFLFPVFSGGKPGLLSPAPPRYRLEDWGGRVAVIDLSQPEAAPELCTIYVNLLPEALALRVKAGWPVPDADTLQQLVADLSARQVFSLQQKDFSAINSKRK